MTAAELRCSEEGKRAPLANTSYKFQFSPNTATNDELDPYQKSRTQLSALNIRSIPMPKVPNRDKLRVNP